MTAELRTEIFRLITEETRELTAQQEIAKNELNGEEIETLRLVFAFTDDAVPAVAEINLISLDDELDAVQIYFTLTSRLSDSGREELKKLMPSLNFYTMFGSFGIYDNDQLYCKYAIALPALNDAKFVFSEVMTALDVLYDSIDTRCPLLYTMAAGNVTFEQAVKDGAVGKV